MSDDAHDAWRAAFAPGPETAVPERVRVLAGDARLEPVWRNGYGGLTFRATDAAGATFYVKYGPRNAESTMAGEAERLRWVGGRTPVPRVREGGADATHEWIVTDAVPGRSAVEQRWVDEPATAVAAIGAGLRAFHEALPVAACPFDWGVPARLQTAAERGIVVPAALRAAPPIDRLVVCHGDACAPNTLIADDGRWSGHVDLGALGVADRWADIAVAVMSVGWNYGPGWGDALLEAYGIRPDPERQAFYEALWNAT